MTERRIMTAVVSAERIFTCRRCGENVEHGDGRRGGAGASYHERCELEHEERKIEAEVRARKLERAEPGAESDRVRVVHVAAGDTYVPFRLVDRLRRSLLADMLLALEGAARYREDLSPDVRDEELPRGR